MVLPHLKILGHGEDNSAGGSERSKKERKCENGLRIWGYGPENQTMFARSFRSNF